MHAGSMISSGLFQAIVAFLSNLILMRYLSPSEFGVFAIVLANASLLASLFNLRINELILRSTSNELESNIDIYFSFIIIQSSTLFIGGCILTYWSGYLNLFAFLIIIAISIGPFIQLKLVLFEKRRRYNKIAILESSSLFFSHFIAVIGVVLGLGALVLYLRVLIQPVLLYIGLQFQKDVVLLNTQKLNFRFSIVKQIWIKSKWIYTDGILEHSVERLTIIAANLISDIATVGLFFQAKRLAVTPHQLLQPFTTRVLLNYFSNSQKKMKKQLLNKVLKIELIVLILASSFIYYFGLQIITLLFGQKWAEVYPLLINLLGIVALLTVFNSFKAYYIAIKEMKIFTYWARVPFIIALVLFFIVAKFLLFEISNINILALSISLAYFISVCSILLKYLNCKN